MPVRCRSPTGQSKNQTIRFNDRTDAATVLPMTPRPPRMGESRGELCPIAGYALRRVLVSL